MRKRPTLYTVWESMRKRCNNKNCKEFNYYGGRGIKVCKEWNDFKCFYKDMIVGYKKGLQLDRVDNNKGYSKENCKWSTPSENASNRRTSIIVNGICAKTQSLKLSASASLIKKRIRMGWKKQDAFSTPKILPLMFHGETATDASKRLGGKNNLVRVRIQKLKWDKKEAFTKPVIKNNYDTYSKGVVHNL
jgi:hypothetical protein